MSNVVRPAMSNEVPMPSDSALGPHPSALRTDVLCVLGLIAISTLLFADVLFLGNNLFFRDLYVYHMPLKRVVYDTILRGELPLWNRLASGGQPMAANPAYQVFYPPQWLLFLGTFEFGYALHIVAHLWLALAGMYALLRTLPLRRASSLFGALSFGLGGLMTGAICNLPTFFAWAWAPLLGCTLLRLVRAPGGRRFAVAALVAAMPLLVGEPFTLLQIWCLLLVATVAYARRQIVLVLATGVASVFAAAVQVLPMLELAHTSSRARGFSYSVAVDWSMPLVRPLELFLPRLFGVLTADGHQYWGMRLWEGRGAPYLLSIYAGALVSILALSGFVARVRGARVTAFIALLSYGLAIGGHTPLFALLYWLGIRSLRYPEKFAAMGVIALIVFAATVANRLEEGEVRVQRLAQLVASLVALFVAAWAIVTLLPPFGAWFLALWRLPDSALQLLPAVRRTAIMAAIIAIGWTALLFAFGRAHKRPALLGAMLLLLLDLGSIANEAVPRMPREFFLAPPAVRELDPGGGAIFARGTWTQQEEAAHYITESRAWFSRNALWAETPKLWGLASVLEIDFDETALLPTHDLLTAMRHLGNSRFPRWSETFMTLSDAGYVFDFRPFADVMREAGGDPELWQPLRIQPVPHQGRYWFARGIVAARSEQELLAALRRTPDVRGLAFVPWPAFPPSPGRIARVHETANATELDVESTGRALLVLTMTRDRHWRATIDGAPATLLPANVAYQALVVPAGRHRVDVRYRNPLITAGAVISGLTLLALVWGAVGRSPKIGHIPDRGR